MGSSEVRSNTTHLYHSFLFAAVMPATCDGIKRKKKVESALNESSFTVNLSTGTSFAQRA